MASPTEVNVGILAPVVAQPGKDTDIESFLQTGYTLSLEEPDTVQWFAIKYADTAPSTYAIFDTFVAPAGRAAHLSGLIAAALVENAPKLLSQPPDIGQVDVLASVVNLSKGAGGAGMTAGLSVGLRVLFDSKPDKVETVKQFLVGARALVLEEAETPVWYAIHFPGTTKFGIVDFFGSEGSRNVHLGGKVAAALFGSVDELLTGPPDLVKVDVLAAKV